METILGISPGTRGIGLATLKNGKLTDWRMQSFQDKWSDKKLKSIIHFITQYIYKNKIEIVAVKLPDELPVSQNYIHLVGALNVLFEQRGIRTTYYTLSDLKKHYCPKQKTNKSILSDCIVSKYPELLPEHHKNKRSRNNYYAKLFEAVATARLYQLSINLLPK